MTPRTTCRGSVAMSPAHSFEGSEGIARADLVARANRGSHRSGLIWVMASGRVVFSDAGGSGNENHWVLVGSGQGVIDLGGVSPTACLVARAR